MSYCSLRLYTDYHGFIRLLFSKPQQPSQGCLYHWLAHIQLQIASMICLTLSNLTAKGWWKKGFLVSFFFRNGKPNLLDVSKEIQAILLVCLASGSKGRGTNSFSCSLWHFSPRLCIAEHDSGEPAKIIKNGRCKNRTRTGFRFPCEGRGNEF